MRAKVLLLTMAISAGTLFAADVEGPVTTVPELKLDQYLGKWHQIATIPAWFQRKCVRNTTAEYARSEDGLISVVNSCIQEDGETSTAEGAARLNSKLNSPSKLQVSFVSILGNWIWAFGGDYWVMDLGTKDGKYNYSVVGNPTREYLWILARKPQLSLEELKVISYKIGAQHYDLSKIIMTQDGELNGKKLSDLSKKPTNENL